MGNLITRGTMTVKQVADALGVSCELVTKKIRELFPDKMEQGKTTYLNEEEATAISIIIKHNPHFVRSYEVGKHQDLFSTENPRNVTEVHTDLEKELMIHQAMQWQTEKISRLRAENQKLSSTVNMLTHTAKTYTTTEIGKELEFKSPQEFNSVLHEKKVIFKVNGTWVLTSQYAGQGYTDTKQQEVNGIVIYNTQWTGKGRLFLLNLFPDRINREEAIK